jgi:hypothetical protein
LRCSFIPLSSVAFMRSDYHAPPRGFESRTRRFVDRASGGRAVVDDGVARITRWIAVGAVI